jgi:beta-glucuronidase
MKARLLLLTLVWPALLLGAEAQSVQGPAPQIINVPNRRTVSLDGGWNYVVDPYGNGYYNYRLQEGRFGYFLNAKPRDESDRVEYDFDKSPLLRVPGDWNTQDPRLYYYEGIIWYKRSFDWTTREGRRLFLYFGAANSRATVYLNGRKLGEHEGGFTPFDFEVTGLALSGENTVVVKVDNSRRRDAVPTVMTDWWNYGGLTRSVRLVDVPKTFIRDYAVRLKKGSRDVIEGWVQIDGPEAATRDLEVSIPEVGARSGAWTDKAGRAEFSLRASLDLWTPENPKLYAVHLKCGADEVTDEIGFRTIEVRGQDILLNGRPIFLRGVSVHEEAPYRTGRACTPEDVRTLVGWAKELDCNFLRLAHYPHSENMVREADRAGLLVWSEIPVYWAILWDNPETYARAEAQLTENITRDKNRACVTIWSIANETPVGEARNAFLRKLVARARALDGTRLISAALEHSYPGDDSTPHVSDPLAEDLDVLAFNEYIGWYDGLPEKIDRVKWVIRYHKPLIVSEFGAGARQGLHGPASRRWTEEFQEDVYRRTIRMLGKIDGLRGTTPWILMDFRSPNRVLPGIQDDFNRKGLVSDQGKKKLAFAVLRDWYRSIEGRRD